MRTRLLGLAVGLVFIAACAARTASSPATPVATRPVAALQVAPPPHPDFANLRRYHNYYRVLEVGEYCHHFVAFYQHDELVTVLYEVPIAPHAPVRQVGESYGLITQRPAAAPIPAAVAPLAEAVKSDIMTRKPAASDPLLVYLGAFRSVKVEEIVVREPTKTKSALFTFRLTLAANQDLTSFAGDASYYMGEGGRLQFEDVAEHPDAPNWIDGGIGRQGRVQLWNLFMKPSPFSADVRRRFEAATLEAARRLQSGAPGLTLAALASERDERTWRRGSPSFFTSMAAAAAAARVRSRARHGSFQHTCSEARSASRSSSPSPRCGAARRPLKPMSRSGPHRSRKAPMASSSFRSRLIIPSPQRMRARGSRHTSEPSPQRLVSWSMAIAFSCTT
jgi:hypothetical protein